MKMVWNKISKEQEKNWWTSDWIQVVNRSKEQELIINRNKKSENSQTIFNNNLKFMNNRLLTAINKKMKYLMEHIESYSQEKKMIHQSYKERISTIE